MFSYSVGGYAQIRYAFAPICMHDLPVLLTPCRWISKKLHPYYIKYCQILLFIIVTISLYDEFGTLLLNIVNRNNTRFHEQEGLIGYKTP